MKATAYARSIGLLTKPTDHAAQKAVEVNREISNKEFEKQARLQWIEQPETLSVIIALQINYDYRLDQLLNFVRSQPATNENLIQVWSYLAQLVVFKNNIELLQGKIATPTT